MTIRSNIAVAAILGFMVTKEQQQKIEDVIEKIKECYTAWELPFIDEGIDRAHIEYLEI